MKTYHWHHRWVAWIVTLVMLLTVLPPVQAAEPPAAFDVTRYNLTWDSPSTIEDDSMPTGNGEIGMNLWTENGRDMVFYISKTGAYSSDGNIRTIKLGRIRVRFPENTFAGENFTQTLNLSTGSIQVQSGDLDLEFWIDANAPVIHVKGSSSEPVDVSVTYELNWNGRPLTEVQTLPENHGATEDVLLDDGSNSIVWYHRNSTSSWESEAKSRYITSEESLALDPVKNLTFGGAIQGTGMERTAADTLSVSGTTDVDVKIDIASCQPDTPQGFVDELSEITAASDAVDYETAYKAHVQWWNDYWDNSYIEITDGTVQKPARWQGDAADLPYIITQNYLLQRFLQGASMRGEQLVPFNGSIFNVLNSKNVNGLTDPDTRAWDGLPIMWQNTRAPYWATLTSGDFEQTETLIHNLYRSLPVLKEGTQNRFGVDGAYLPEPMNPLGVPADPYTAGHLIGHFTATAEIPLLMVRYYVMSGNLELFQSEIMPFVEACVDFFDQNYPENDENGKMIMYPVNSLESGTNATNPTSIIGPLTALLDELLALPNGSLSAAQIQKFVRVRNRMPELSLREKDGVTFIAQEESREGFYHGVESPELYSVWPSNLHAGYETEELSIARQTFAARTKYWNLFGDTGKVDTTGGWNQSTIFAAKLGLPYETGYLLAQVATSCMDAFTYPGMPMYDNGWLESRFPAFWGPNYDWKPDQCHGGNVMNALQAMLLQYDADGTIYLLSSWPEDWDVNFRLHGPYETVVTGSYQDGKLTYTTNNGYDQIVDLSTYEQRVVNRVSVACGDENYVFDKDPMPDGKYDASAMGQYTVTGTWLEQYGHTLNDTVGAGYGWNDWGGATWNRETGTLYLHLTDFDGQITLPLPDIGTPDSGTTPVCVTDPDAVVTLQLDERTMTVTVPTESIDPVDTIVALQIAAAPEPETEMVNDNDPAIIYNGNFTYHPNRGYGEYQDDIHQGVNNYGDSIEYTFTGSGVDVIATMGGAFADYEVFIDDEETGTLAHNASQSVVPQAVVYSRRNLPYGEHTIRVVSLSDKANAYTAFDAFRIYKDVGEPQEIRSVVQPAAVTVPFGTAWEAIDTLPQTVTAILDSGETSVPVHWTCAEYDSQSAGSYFATGTLEETDTVSNPDGLTARLELAVEPKPRDDVQMLDDPDPAIQYDGEWVAQSNQPYGQYLGTQHYTTTEGDTFTLTFTGTGVDYISEIGPNRGKVELTLDGEPLGVEDLFRPSAVPQARAYSLRDLPNTEHTLTGKMVDGEYFTVDAFRVHTGTGLVVDSVEELKPLQVKRGTALADLGLPESLEVTLDDGSTQTLSLTGDWMGTYDPDTDGTYTLRRAITLPEDGSISNPSNYRAMVQVVVSESGSTNPDQIILLTTTLPAGVCGAEYPTTQLEATGGKPPYTFTARNLPDGLTLSKDGILSGTPETAGTYPVILLVEDAAGHQLYHTCQLEISEAVHTHEMTHTPEKAATCTETGNTEYWYCAGCGKYFSDAEGTTEITKESTVIPVIAHTPVTVAGKKPTCTETGLTDGSQCSVCGKVLTEQKEIPALGHDFGTEWKSDKSGHWHECSRCDATSAVEEHIPGPEATETEPQVCTVCGYILEPETGHITHTPGTEWYHDETQHWHKCIGCEEKLDVENHSGGTATCTEQAVCEVCGAPYGELAEHTYEWDYDDNQHWKACEDCGAIDGSTYAAHTWVEDEELSGEKTVWYTCECGAKKSESRVTATPTYILKAEQAEGGKISPESKAVSRGGELTFTITPDAGYKIADVLVDGKSVGTVSEYTFKNVSGHHTITAQFTNGTAPVETVKGFSDVTVNDWFADAVEYVVDNGLMNGTSATTFSPKGDTTRGMIVTILYRLAGSPEVESDGATWWSDARVWAMEEGISDGTNMDGKITREQLAAMLYRYAGSEAVKGDLSAFADAESVSDWAVDALIWATSNEIVTGKTGNLIDPGAGATRAETAAMLMRYGQLEK